MKGNGLDSVIASCYKQKSSSNRSLDDVSDATRFKDKLYPDINRVNKVNNGFNDTRTQILIDWKKTLDYQIKVGNGDEWIEYILDQKTIECEDLKFEIGFPTTESYTKRVDSGRGPIKKNEYIKMVEKQIEDIKSLSVSIKEEDTFEGLTIKEVKSLIKSEELGIRATKEDTAETLMIKVEEARASKE